MCTGRKAYFAGIDCLERQIEGKPRGLWKQLRSECSDGETAQVVRQMIRFPALSVDEHLEKVIVQSQSRISAPGQIPLVVCMSHAKSAVAN
jgi:hypothetical protein